VQYVPKDLNENSVSIEHAIRDIYQPQPKTMTPKQSKSKHGGFDQVYMKHDTEKRNHHLNITAS
jgi:hypothetical protein